jgi:GH35 family endo-1,4-beta-xylanase
MVLSGLRTLNPQNKLCLPDNYVEEVYRLAERYFHNSTLLYNDNNQWWRYQADCSPVYLLVRHLLDRGLRVGGLGLQYHMFDWLLDQANLFMDPRHIYKCLDQYGKLDIPVNFSEVSIVSRRDFGDGDRFQEIVTEKLYRLWFSHPATNGIVWWNLVDGTAAYAPLGSEGGENKLRGGLVNYDFSSKPAYKVLENLIKDEWNTQTVVDYEAGGDNRFHGFYGEYDVTVSTNEGRFEKHMSLSKHSDNNWEVTCQTDSGHI